MIPNYMRTHSMSVGEKHPTAFDIFYIREGKEHWLDTIHADVASDLGLNGDAYSQLKAGETIEVALSEVIRCA